MKLDEKTSELRIPKVVEKDSGEYSCEARNRLGNVARSTVTINVNFGCGYVQNNQLTSPEYPNFYPDGMDCTYWVNISLGWTLTIYFRDFEVESQSSCRYDYLRITNERNVLFGKYCGTETGRSVSVTGRYAVITFHSDGSVRKKGYNLIFSDPNCVSPRILFSPVNQSVTVGNPVNFTCRASGDPTPKVTWTFDGSKLPFGIYQTKFEGDSFMESFLDLPPTTKEMGGTYKCIAENKANTTSSSATLQVSEKPTSQIRPNPHPILTPAGKVRSPSLVWYFIVGSMAAVIVILLICWYFWKRRTIAAAMALPNHGQAVEMELLNIEVDEWEVEVNRVLLQEVIGRGAFGAVWRALLSSPNGRPGNRTVAAKCFTPTAGEEGRKCLMREIELGKIIGESNQPNIVKFIGCVTRQVHPILIMEYLPCGDLLGYMRKCRGVKDRYYLGEGRAQDLNNYDLVLFAKQIAAGMVFLGSRGIIHRDLAARNVLLDNNYVCKVTDFGMAYQSFKYGHGNAKKGCLPIKWTAPEILLGELAGLSALSDVWSYGIVLYEIVTLGGTPYDGWSEGKVVAQVTRGYKLPKPDHVDDKLYAVMKRCWNFNPDFRPPFENLRKRMDTYLREETYLHLLDMGSYDTTKYSKVEDLGDEDAEPTARTTTNAAAKRLGKWTSDRRQTPLF
ncbi:fibroblast growth factor receptor homolog 1-like isoform X3 [Stylophora pistillata]|uniref:fibroblast growth factor receptor homolog 1-like isoform X3 n=1 Tax=Stylophora pistillata TaxID=50429 RepID=UPI000C03A270|nr:fibroblast growth factor receptor homolog 1-like isoform X3 [Stylophora pistillata]